MPILNIILSELKHPPNEKSSDGWAALHYASFNGLEAAALYLIEHKALINDADKVFSL
jgi:ankyrin repeat protein